MLGKRAGSLTQSIGDDHSHSVMKSTEIDRNDIQPSENSVHSASEQKEHDANDTGTANANGTANGTGTGTIAIVLADEKGTVNYGSMDHDHDSGAGDISENHVEDGNADNGTGDSD